IIQIEYEDGEKETLQIPAEIWSRDSRSVSKLIITSKTIKSVEVDPRLQTADVERENNYLPRRVIKSRFELFKDEKKKNEMQKAKAAEDGQDDDDDDDDEEDEDEEDE
ncbi:MAG: aminopeptidase, partial [Planctomycetales bacterium]|nr:aminopeptidase [Planctomycetales bacterium]